MITYRFLFQPLAARRWQGLAILLTFLTPCACGLPNDSTGVCFPLPYYDDPLTVPVTIDGHEYLFMVDSGATHHFFDVSLQDLLGDSAGNHEIKDAGGSAVTAKVFKPPKASIGAMPLAPIEWVAAVDLKTMRAATGRDIRGILGMPLFGSSVIQIDFDARQLRILPPDTPPTDDWGIAIPVIFDESNLPYIHPTFAKEESEYCIIDTGSSFILETRSNTFHRLLERKAISAVSSTNAATLGGTRKLQEGILTEFQLAERVHRELRVAETTGKSRIGLGYLRRFRVTFDLANGKMYLKPGFDVDKPDNEPRIGVHVLRQDGKTVIVEVDDGSPAQQAGVQANDELIAVDGVATENKPIAEIMWPIKRRIQKQPVEITLRREGKDLKVRMTPQP